MTLSDHFYVSNRFFVQDARLTPRSFVTCPNLLPHGRKSTSHLLAKVKNLLFDGADPRG